MIIRRRIRRIKREGTGLHQPLGNHLDAWLGEVVESIDGGLGGFVIALHGEKGGVAALAVSADLLQDSLQFDLRQLKPVLSLIYAFLDPWIVWRFPCVNCRGLIEMPEKELNCRIFRHGVELNPHASKQLCDNYHINTKQRLGFEGGCGQPMRFDNGLVLPCDYI